MGALRVMNTSREEDSHLLADFVELPTIRSEFWPGAVMYVVLRAFSAVNGQRMCRSFFGADGLAYRG